MSARHKWSMWAKRTPGVYEKYCLRCGLLFRSVERPRKVLLPIRAGNFPAVETQYSADCGSTWTVLIGRRPPCLGDQSVKAHYVTLLRDE